MSSFSLFLNTKIERTGTLSYIGNLGLTPVRYLFGGKTVRADYDGNLSIHHVSSFHPEGERNLCKTWRPRPVNPLYKGPGRPEEVAETKPFTSSSTSFLKTILSIIFLVPGIFLSAFKLASYLYAENRQIHQQVQRHFTPIIRHIGTKDNPIHSQEELAEALAIERDERDHPYHQPTDAIIVRSDGTLTIHEDPGFLHFNPMKIILQGARISDQDFSGASLDQAMVETGKWAVAGANEPIGGFHCDINTIERALEDPLPSRGWDSCKKMHMAYQLRV